jgi:hypothetical protein
MSVYMCVHTYICVYVYKYCCALVKLMKKVVGPGAHIHTCVCVLLCVCVCVCVHYLLSILFFLSSLLRVKRSEFVTRHSCQPQIIKFCSISSADPVNHPLLSTVRGWESGIGCYSTNPSHRCHNPLLSPAPGMSEQAFSTGSQFPPLEKEGLLLTPWWMASE